MSVVAALIVFSGLGAFVCARSRAAGPALLFGVVAVVLFCTTPVGSGLPGGLAALAEWIGSHAGTALNNNAGGAR